MILTNRLFERIAPSRDAKSIYIFCEGLKREYDYFKYFKAIDSRINLEIYKLDPTENNSPAGLISIAEVCILKTELNNNNPKYNFVDGDEVWIVFDTDEDRDQSRESQIQEIREKCEKQKGWFIAQSNPCFEVWLYYHLHSEKPNFQNNHKCVKWKSLVNRSIAGGFDSRRHPVYFEAACVNAENNFNIANGIMDIGSTEVFKLAKVMIPLISEKIQKAKEQI